MGDGIMKLNSEKLFKEYDICMQVNPYGYINLTKEEFFVLGTLAIYPIGEMVPIDNLGQKSNKNFSAIIYA